MGYLSRKSFNYVNYGRHPAVRMHAALTAGTVKQRLIMLWPSLLINAVEESIINGFLSADSITTLFYLIQKVKNKLQAKNTIKLLLEIFEISPVNRSVIQEAINIDFNDFEDAVVYQSAFFNNCDGIVTSNTKDFKKLKINIYNPKELLNAIKYRD